MGNINNRTGWYSKTPTKCEYQPFDVRWAPSKPHADPPAATRER
jgi:hypothetical protein